LIVIFIDNIENFVFFLERRIMNEIFYETKVIKGEIDLSSEVNIEIILHFLSKVQEYIVLFETKLTINKPANSNIDDEVINELQSIFNKVDSSLILVKGKIREIFLSYTS